MGKNELRYDKSLNQFLTDNGFTYHQMTPLLPVDKSWVWAVRADEKTEVIINKVSEMFPNGGCIFTLPGDQKDWPEYVYWTRLMPEEIRRRVAMKAFL